MSRNLSLGFREALFSQASTVVPIFLLTINHEELEEPIYITTDATQRLSTNPLTYGTISRGITFLYVAASITIPDEQDRSPPTCKLMMSNIDRSIIPLIRSVSTPPSVKIEAVLSTDVDFVEMLWPSMDISNVQYNSTQLEFDLTMDALTTEPYPNGIFSPAYFPGLFY